jgi:hypothetical protein
MSDDIVMRLREAGECPTPLRAYLARAVVLQAADEIARLRAERDEARRLICDLSWEDSKEVAAQLGWDCFKGAK